MSQYTIQFLLKFGKQENLVRLLNEGMFYAAPLHSFKKEDTHDRYDKYEGLRDLLHLDENVILEFKAEEDANWKRLNVTSGVMNVWNDVQPFHNFSMFLISKSVTQEQEYYPIPDKMKEFGDHFLLIQNVRQFIERVKSAVEKAGLKCIHSPIEYYDAKQNQKGLGLFNKSDHHQYENEFRILIENASTEPTILYMGSIADIASLHHVNEFTGFRFVWPDNGNSDSKSTAPESL